MTGGAREEKVFLPRGVRKTFRPRLSGMQRHGGGGGRRLKSSLAIGGIGYDLGSSGGILAAEGGAYWRNMGTSCHKKETAYFTRLT